MKPVLEKISKSLDTSFFVGVYKEKYFPSPLHFHPEIEIIFIVTGYGTRVVGDSIDNFFPGDLILIGPNIPHVFASDQVNHQEDTLFSTAIVIQFEKSFLGDVFTALPEFQKALKLLENSRQGIQFSNKSNLIIQNKILNFPNLLGLNRIISLLEILEIMASDMKQKLLSSPNFTNSQKSIKDIHRMEVLYQFIFKNFTRNIKIEEVSDIINLSPHSFCRYFKSRTNISFSTFVNQVRIGNACKLLIEDNSNITQIAYESGFNHLSHFNRQFMIIKKMTPSEYRKKCVHQINL